MSITQDTALFALACFWVAGWAVVALLVHWQWEVERDQHNTTGAAPTRGKKEH